MRLTRCDSLNRDVCEITANAERDQRKETHPHAQRVNYIGTSLPRISVWVERKQRFAGVIHWLNLLFKPARRGRRAKLAG